MQYQEFQPKPLLSQHVECFWELQLSPGELGNPAEVLPPDCTYDVLFSAQPLHLNFFHKKQNERVERGATLVGQKTTGVWFSARTPTAVFGIRFKPFAFANLIEMPLCRLNDRVLPLDEIFNLGKRGSSAVQQILEANENTEKIAAAEQLVLGFLGKSFPVDQTLRAQLNYILDRKGLVRITDMFAEFGVSKATLHSHFTHRIGLSPKKISRIWRINYFLQLHKNAPGKNLTELGLEAGFYDQAHFIKEFRSFFGECPRRFFQQDSQLVKISQQIIERRFSNQYDPR